jgi:hypothetical protein
MDVLGVRELTAPDLPDYTDAAFDTKMLAVLVSRPARPGEAMAAPPRALQ